MNNKKEIERAEIHKTIWRIANDLHAQRGRLGFQELCAWHLAEYGRFRKAEQQHPVMS